jgi:hypothetical protein
VSVAGGDEPGGDGGGVCGGVPRRGGCGGGGLTHASPGGVGFDSFLCCFVSHLRRWKRLPLLFLLQREAMWRWCFVALCEVSSDTFVGSHVCEVDGMRFFMFMPRFSSPSSSMVQLRVLAAGSLCRQIRNPQAGSAGAVVGGAAARCFWLFCESVDDISYGDTDKFFWLSDVRQRTAADDFSSPVLLKMVADACSMLMMRLSGVAGCEFLRHFQCLTPLVKDGGGCAGSPTILTAWRKFWSLELRCVIFKFSNVFYVK